MNSIKINHNNVSHTERMGLIIKDSKGYKLTPLGAQLYDGKLSFEQVLKRQMLRYFSTIKEDSGVRILFPYRACFKILLSIKSINFIEFVFGLYSLIDSSSERLNQAIEDIKFLRKNYPNLELLSEANKPKVLKELNEYFKTNFSATDIWEKKTTINNQYIYFRNHLVLFNNLIEIDERKRTIKIRSGKEAKVKSILLRDDFIENEKNLSTMNDKYIQKIVIFMLFNL